MSHTRLLLNHPFSLVPLHSLHLKDDTSSVPLQQKFHIPCSGTDSAVESFVICKILDFYNCPLYPKNKQNFKSNLLLITKTLHSWIRASTGDVKFFSWACRDWSTLYESSSRVPYAEVSCFKMVIFRNIHCRLAKTSQELNQS